MFLHDHLIYHLIFMQHIIPSALLNIGNVLAFKGFRYLGYVSSSALPTVQYNMNCASNVLSYQFTKH